MVRNLPNALLLKETEIVINHLHVLGRGVGLLGEWEPGTEVVLAFGHEVNASG